MHSKFSALILAAALLPVASPALTAEPDAPAAPQTEAAKVPAFLTQPTLLNWGPARQQWEQKGVKLNVFYITDAQGDFAAPAGSQVGFGNFQRIAGSVDVDLSKVAAAPGLSFHIDGLWQNGIAMMDHIGSFVKPSGIQSVPQFRASSVWLRQRMAGGKVNLTVGSFASLSTFGVQEYGAKFFTLPLSYSYQNMLGSYDPQNGPAAMIRVEPSQRYHLMAGWFMPSDDSHTPGHQYRTRFLNYHNGTHGSTANFEAGVHTFQKPTATGKLYGGVTKAGFLYNGSKAGSSNPIMGHSGFFDYNQGKYVDGDWDAYVQINQPVWRAEAASARGLDLTLSVNTRDQARSMLPTELTAGAVWNAPWRKRAQDSLAIGLVQSVVGAAYNRYQHATGGTVRRNETEFEINYRAQLTPWLVLQPEWQYFHHVGGRPAHAAVAGFRWITTF